LITLTIFLFDEFKYILKNEKCFPDPQKSLTYFASIIKDNDGIRKLKLIVDRQREILKSDPDHREAKEIRIVAEEILIHSFGIETRPTNRIPENEVMKYKQSFIDCVQCFQTTADTILFPCEHVTLCHQCASKTLNKIYSKEKANHCPLCEQSVPLLDAPWHLLREKPFSIVIN
jgi:hypothetical protein